jgi:hypothetical protein
MSIFKSTLKPFVAAQLKAREKVIGQVENNIAGVGVRDNTFLRYTTGKNGWVRMISMVNYNSQKFNKNTGRYEPDGRYTGDALSKKYILEGGTLYGGGKGFTLRKGVNQADGVYGSDIDKVNADPKSNKIDRTYGIRPMPGITSVQVNNKSAYGSLREATINFYAWDKHQLEELEVLFMRPGYSVWLDWGWSQYIDHNVQANGINTYPDNIAIKNYDVAIPNLFQDIYEDNIYTSIDSAIEKSKGNYDAMIGFVKNFSWQLMSNGGWQCSTTLISRGEVIEEIKASNNPRTIIGSKVENAATETPEDETPPFSFFEQVFTTLKAVINKSEFTDLGNPPPPISKEEEESKTETLPADKPKGEFYNQGAGTEGAAKAISNADDKFKSIWEGLKQTSFKNKVYTVNANGKEDIYNFDGYYANSIQGGVLPTEGTADGSGIEYIAFDLFIAILQRYFIPRIENGDTKSIEPLVYIVIPGKTPCLMSEDTVSVDPLTCLVYNPYATFITGLDTGFIPTLYTSLDWDSTSKTLKPGKFLKIPTYPSEKYVKTGKQAKIPDISDPKKTKDISYNIVNIGELGSIYISIGKILQTYRSLSSPNGVNVVDLLTNILEDVSLALGGINDFKLYTEKNIIQIIDTKYLESGEPANSKFKMDLIGLKSICRDVKINSRIFPEQASMIAIGATAGGDVSNNLGDVYSSSQILFNKGLKDRVIRDLNYSKGTDSSTAIVSDKNLYYFNVYNNIRSLTTYIKRKVLGINDANTYTNPSGSAYNSIKAPTEEEISNASNLLKTFHYQLNGKDVDFKALIPFELEITLDGISGCTIGQIFTIDQSILPRDYYNKNLGFVITGISHALQNNDWTTTLKTQICLLDNEDYASNVDKAELKQIVETLKAQNQARAYLFYAMVDYVIYLIIRIMTNNGATKSKKPFLIGTQAVVNGDGMNTEYFSIDNIQSALYRISDEEWGKDIGEYGYGVTSDNIGYNGIHRYIELWWNTNKTNTSLPNFPTGSYDDFLKIVLPDGTALPLATGQLFINKFGEYLLNPGPSNDTSLKSDLTIKNGKIDKVKENFFIYKFFGVNPKDGIDKFLTTKTIQETVTRGKEARQETVTKQVPVIDLKTLYPFLLKKVQDYIDENQYFTLFIQGTESPFISSEVDLKGDGLYKLDI